MNIFQVPRGQSRCTEAPPSSAEAVFTPLHLSQSLNLCFRLQDSYLYNCSSLSPRHLLEKVCIIWIFTIFCQEQLRWIHYVLPKLIFCFNAMPRQWTSKCSVLWGNVSIHHRCFLVDLEVRIVWFFLTQKSKQRVKRYRLSLKVSDNLINDNKSNLQNFTLKSSKKLAKKAHNNYFCFEEVTLGMFVRVR